MTAETQEQVQDETPRWFKFIVALGLLVWAGYEFYDGIVLRSPFWWPFKSTFWWAPSGAVVAFILAIGVIGLDDAFRNKPREPGVLNPQWYEVIPMVVFIVLLILSFF